MTSAATPSRSWSAIRASESHRDRPLHPIDHEQIALAIVTHHVRRAVPELGIDIVDVGVWRFGDMRIRRDDRLLHFSFLAKAPGGAWDTDVVPFLLSLLLDPSRVYNEKTKDETRARNRGRGWTGPLKLRYNWSWIQAPSGFPDPTCRTQKCGVPAGLKESSDGIRPQDNGRYDYRRHRFSCARGRRRDQGRQDRRRGRGSRQGSRDRRGARPRGRPRLRRHPHALRRADPVGPHDDHIAVARRDHGGYGQLRLRRRADAPRASRTHHANARESRGDEPRRAGGGARL